MISNEVEKRLSSLQAKLSPQMPASKSVVQSTVSSTSPFKRPAPVMTTMEEELRPIATADNLELAKILLAEQKKVDNIKVDPSRYGNKEVNVSAEELQKLLGICNDQIQEAKDNLQSLPSDMIMPVYTDSLTEEWASQSRHNSVDLFLEKELSPEQLMARLDASAPSTILGKHLPAINSTPAASLARELGGVNSEKLAEVFFKASPRALEVSEVQVRRFSDILDEFEFEEVTSALNPESVPNPSMTAAWRRLQEAEARDMRYRAEKKVVGTQVSTPALYDLSLDLDKV